MNMMASLIRRLQLALRRVGAKRRIGDEDQLKFWRLSMTTLKVKETNDPRRIQFDLLPQRLVELDQLMEFCDLHSRKDLFDNAMTLFEWAVHEVRSGRAVASYDRKTDHVEIVRFPVLENAARRALTYKKVSLVDTSESSEDDAQDPSPKGQESASGGATPTRMKTALAASY
jgi:hypothetical protein